MIRVRGLVKHYGLKPVLRGLDFSVESGEFVALVGPNGAGKTTFLRILTSLARPTAGQIQIAGVPIPGGESQVRRYIGVVAHQPMLYGDLTAEENLQFFARMYDVAEVSQQVEESLRTVGLWKVRGELLRAFSRGMQQRLAIARAILHEPQLLLFDEPHTGLDQDASVILDELLLEVAGQGRTVVMTSHDLPRAHRLASRVDVLSRGRVAASIATDQETADGLTLAYQRATHG